MSMNFSGLSRSSWIGRVMRAPLQLIPRGSRVPILQGPLRGSWWIVGAGNHGCWLGSYEHEKQTLFADTIGKGAVVYDVGANVGFYTLLASHLVELQGRVIAFEPVPRNLVFLRKHIMINKLSNVDVIDAAVCDREGEATFDDSCDSSMGQLTADGSLRVRTVSIDALIARGTIPPPEFLKIDVEGAEGLVLVGASQVLRTNHPTIFLATHGEVERSECTTILRAAGYNVRPIGADSFMQSDEFLALPV